LRLRKMAERSGSIQRELKEISDVYSDGHV
jgi:hypothetical protein